MEGTDILHTCPSKLEKLFLRDPMLETKLEEMNDRRGVGWGGSADIIITSDKYAVVFNYQVFTLLPHTSIAWTPKNLTHTVDTCY